MGAALCILATASACASAPPGPGWPTVGPAPHPPVHVLRLRRLERQRAIFDLWQGEAETQASIVTLDRRGEVVDRAPAPSSGPPPVVRPSTPPRWPISLGRHRLNLRATRWTFEVVLEPAGVGDAPSGEAVVLATLPRDPALHFGEVRVAHGRRPELAVLSWWLETAGAARVEGAEILDLRRGRASLVLRRGLTHHRAGRIREARELFSHAHEIDPGLVEATYDLACAEARLDRREAALGYLEEALRQEPDRIRVLAEEDEDLETLREDGSLAEVLERAR